MCQRWAGVESPNALERCLEPEPTWETGCAGFCDPKGLIVNKLGGDLKAQSQEGKGTMFTIYLPKNSRDHASARK